MIPTFDMAINELFNEKHQGTVLEHQIQVRTFNVDKTKNMRSLNPEDIDQMITISGMLSNFFLSKIFSFFSDMGLHRKLCWFSGFQNSLSAFLEVTQIGN